MTPCRWCDKPLPPAKDYANGVCADCYRLLHGAGVSDEEIFGEGRISVQEDAAASDSF